LSTGCWDYSAGIERQGLSPQAKEAAGPGTTRDSLFILDALHRLDAREQPEILTTDTASYSDIVFGLFAICGYQFALRISDIGDAQQWWIDPTEDREDRENGGVKTLRSRVSP
jgi:TnpA family transposase